MDEKTRVEKILMDGIEYTLRNGVWYQGYTRVSKSEMYKLNSLRSKSIDYDNMDLEELIDMAQSMKDSEDYLTSKKIFETLLEKRVEPKVARLVLSRYTSVLRKLGKPQEAIDTAEIYLSVYGGAVKTPALFTSLAGAYCDIGDYFEARKKANVAMAMSGGKAGPELQSVYARIKSLEK